LVGRRRKGNLRSSEAEENLDGRRSHRGELKQGAGQVEETWGDAKEKVGAEGDADRAEDKSSSARAS
jgi:hypothetical protein